MAFSQNRFPKAWTVDVLGNTTFGADNLITIPGLAVFTQIWNQGEHSLDVRLNNDPEATFTLGANVAQIFNSSDLYITSIDFENTPSGAETLTVQVIVGVVAND
jgi:hypothetical protein